MKGNELKMKGDELKMEGHRFKMKGNELKMKGNELKMKGNRLKIKRNRLKIKRNRFGTGFKNAYLLLNSFFKSASKQLLLMGTLGWACRQNKGPRLNKSGVWLAEFSLILERVPQ